MQQPTLYLMLGYPGAGKTIVSRQLATRTGAVHLWADHERRAMFARPTHSKDESDKLYARLNERTDQLLRDGKSVIFDTSFNHFYDREYLRGIAARYHAKVILIWLATPRETAKARATNATHAVRNTYAQTMTAEEFDRIASHLEPPHSDETVIKIDGADLSQKELDQKVSDLISAFG